MVLTAFDVVHITQPYEVAIVTIFYEYLTAHIKGFLKNKVLVNAELVNRGLEPLRTNWFQ